MNTVHTSAAGSPVPTGHPPLAIITGASSGIGNCIARELAKRGLRLALLGRQVNKLKILADELSSAGTSSFVYSLDLMDTQAIAPTVRQVLAEHGPVEVLVNNAGFGVYKPFIELTPQLCDELMRVNFTAAMEITREVLPEMLQQKHGCVINITSMSARFGPWGHSVYAASKAALATWTQSMAIEHEKTGVHFCAVYPGLVDTPYFHEPTYRGLFERIKKRMISPQTVAKQVVKLLDRPRLDLCIPRHYRLIDWIHAVSPRLVQHIVSKESRPPGK